MKQVLGLAGLLLVAQSPSWDNPPKQPVAGVEHKTFHSESMKVEVGYNLYLPPDYAGNGEKRYPVIYWLHGLGGNESSSISQIVRILDPAIREKKVPPLIMVFANGGSRTRYHDSVDGKVMAETLIARELIPHVDKAYRTIASKEGRAIQGMSMGGNGGLKFAFKYPELFSSVVAYAPAVLDGEAMAAKDPEFIRTMFGGDKEAYHKNIAAEVLKKNADNVRGKVAILILVGTKDDLLEKNRKMRDLLTELKVPHGYEEHEGVTHNLGGLLAQSQAAGLEFSAKHFGPGK